MSYELDGEQYVAQLVGYGVPGYGNSNGSRLLVYKLGGTAATPPAPPEPAPLELNPPEQFADAATVAHGETVFIANCGMCHESSFANRGLFPNLRYSARLNSQEAFDAVVLHGALEANGMVGFDDVLDPPDAVAVRAYIVDLAHRLREQQQAQAQAGAQGGPR
jgi:mono/diheme cytochrome c family protein